MASSQLTLGDASLVHMPCKRCHPAYLMALNLRAEFQRLGAPTVLLLVGAHICIGTQSGTVLAVPKGSAQRSSADFAVELKPPAGVGRLLTSLFARYSFLAHGPHLNQLAQHSRSLIGSHP